jgi:triacylglycerol lipase
MTKKRLAIMDAGLSAWEYARATIAGAAQTGRATDEPTSGAELVVLLHGLGRTGLSMWPLKHYLSLHGYDVAVLNYPSRTSAVPELAQQVAEQATSLLAGRDQRVNFVTHSLGGILVRYIAADGLLPNIGRVVMLCPPNQGSEIVDRLGDLSLYQKATGPAGLQLGTRRGSVPRSLGPVDFELGIITGNKSINPLLSQMITGDDDGKVSVENAKVEGMADFLVVGRSHTFIMNSPDVLPQVVHFFKEGRFESPVGA